MTLREELYHIAVEHQKNERLKTLEAKNYFPEERLNQIINACKQSANKGRFTTYLVISNYIATEYLEDLAKVHSKVRNIILNDVAEYLSLKLDMKTSLSRNEKIDFIELRWG